MVGLALIAVKVGDLFGWNLLWLYVVAGVVDVAILAGYLVQRRGRSEASGSA